MRGVAISATKGGVGKTSLAHALGLGAALMGKPAYFMHTDARKPIKVSGRPYGYYDARDPKTLVTLIEAMLNDDGLCIIDSGGNRPEFDQWIADSVDLVVIPVNPDPEAVTEGLEQMKRHEDAGAENVRFFLNMYPSGKIERDYVNREFLYKLPVNKIMGRVGEVKAIRRLKMSDDPKWVTPPSRVNNLARSFYRQIDDALDQQATTATEIEQVAAV